MLTITILYHNTLCFFFLNAITISTVGDIVCDNKRLPRCLSVNYTNAYTPTSYTVITISCLRYNALVSLW